MIYAVFLCDNNGKLKKVRQCCPELTLKENKEINEKLDEARVWAEKASLSKTRFLANTSHDGKCLCRRCAALSGCRNECPYCVIGGF